MKHINSENCMMCKALSKNKSIKDFGIDEQKDFIGYWKLDTGGITKAYEKNSYVYTFNPKTSEFEGKIVAKDFKNTWRQISNPTK